MRAGLAAFSGGWWFLRAACGFAREGDIDVPGRAAEKVSQRGRVAGNQFRPFFRCHGRFQARLRAMQIQRPVEVTHAIDVFGGVFAAARSSTEDSCA